MPSPAEILAQAMQRAQRLAQAGDLAGAAQLCRAILKDAPGQFFPLLMLGSIENQAGRHAEAEKLLRQALAANPRSPEALTAYGDALLSLNRHSEAIETLSRALALQPQNPVAPIYRGIAFASLHKREQALADFNRALALDPNSVFALHNRANVLTEMGRWADAQADVDRLLKIAPGYVPAIANRVLILMNAKRHADAVAECDRGLKIDARNPTLWNRRAQALTGLRRHEDALKSIENALAIARDVDNLVIHGNVLGALNRSDEAMAAYDAALALDPNSAEAHLNRANIFMERDRLAEAESECAAEIAARPDYAPPHLLLGNILLHLRRDEEALAAYDAAIAAFPDNADAHYHRGSARLLTGHMTEGWEDFEHRWKSEQRGSDPPRLNAREWKGEPPAGRSIVVYSEQGHGDTIQFARFLPRLTALGARVTFLCHPTLVALLRAVAPDMETIASCDAARPFDFQVALGSLPHRFDIGLEGLGDAVPYVFAEEDRVARWREKIGAEGFKIGIVWQGNPIGAIDKGRSVPLEKFRPLADVPGVRLISLQKVHGLDQLERLPGMRVETLGAFDEGDDAFLDTAAIMKTLDLIVMSDTAPAHLAGALGVPVWVALKCVPDWRWMLDRSDSPWYPTMRLFRQQSPGDWDGVFAAIAAGLRERAGEKR